MSARIPFADFDLQFKVMDQEIMDNIRTVLESGKLILREHVVKFEKSFAEFIGVKHAIGVSSGTDAVYLSLRGCGIGPGDEVITVAHTFVATVSEIVHAGATPVLIDVAEDHNMDVSLLESAITARTRAIVVVHLNGRACDMEPIMQIAEANNLLLIEDSAQGLGSKYNGHNVSTFGKIGSYSFYPGKILGAAGDGGAIVTNDDQIAEKVRLLRDHGRLDRVELACWGYNCRLDAIQAAILSAKLLRVPQWIEHRRKLADIYHSGLAHIEQLELPPPPECNSKYFDSFQNYAILSERRDELSEFLLTKGIETLIYWAKPIHRQKNLNLGHFQLPKTEKISETTLSLPMNANVTLSQANQVVEAIQAFYA